MSSHPKTKNDSRLCLLQAAAKLFSRCGLEKTSTRDISKESKANISLISYHFGGKEGLYKEVIRQFALDIQRTFDAQMEQSQKQKITKESFYAEIEAILENVMRMRELHPDICKILSREKLEGFPMSRDIHEEIFYPLTQKFNVLFDQAKKEKIIREDVNPTVFLILITEGFFGFSEIMDCHTRARADMEPLLQNPKEFRKMIVDLFLKGAYL